MRETLRDEEQIRRYLLGELSEAEMSRLEDEAFTGHDAEDLKWLIASVENDLMDEYARGELSPGELARFEARFLTSAGRKRRVRFAAALVAAGVEARDSRVGVTGGSPLSLSPLAFALSLLRTAPPALKFALALGALELAVVAVWYAADVSRRRTEAARVESERRLAEARDKEGAHEAASPTPRASPLPAPPRDGGPSQKGDTRRRPAPAIASFTLLPGSLRGEGAGPQFVSIPKGVRFVRLRLMLDEIVLRGGVRVVVFAGERKVVSRAGVPVRRVHSGNLVTLKVPARHLAAGSYHANLEGQTVDGGVVTSSYDFRVARPAAASRPE